MVLAPFYLLAAIVLLNGDFDFLEHSACDAADRIAQGIDGLAGIEIEYVDEIFMLEIGIRIVGASGIHTITDAGSDSPPKGHFDVIFIILLKITIGNDVEDGLLVVLPILNSQLIGNFFKLHFHRAFCLNAKGSFHSFLDGFTMLFLHRPQLIQSDGITTSAGVGYIENVSQIGLITVGHEQSYALGTTLDIAVLIFQPGIIWRG